MPDTELYVLLRHDDAGRPDCFKPYHTESLRRYCDRPPANARFRLQGIYPSSTAARRAMMEDIKAIRRSRRRRVAGEKR